MLDTRYQGNIRLNWPQRLFLILPMLCLSCLSFTGCDGQDKNNPQPRAAEQFESQQQTPPTEIDNRPRIVALGDSLTAGLGVPPDESYPSRLQRRLDKSDYSYRVINAGVSGDTSAGALRRLNWVLKSQPSIVIIELGANDGLRGQPVKNIYENLRQIIQGLQEAGVTVLLTGMMIPPNYGAAYTSQFNEMYAKLADEFHIAFMPFFLEGVAAHRALNQADGIHPTGEGYGIIIDNLFEVLEPLLKADHSTTSS